MFDSKTIDELTTRLTNMLPTGALEFQRDLEKNLRAILSSAFARLDLVTREEFEVQKALLDGVQGRITVLEQQIEVLLAATGTAIPTIDKVDQP